MPDIYPPQNELNALWAGAVPVTQSSEVCKFLDSRGMDPGAVARLDVARALSPWTATYRWCDFWYKAGARLLVPMFDERTSTSATDMRGP